jgi:D-alanine-D-alanine ligase
VEHIFVFFGGRSTEHDVSIVTALSAVIKPLKVSGAYRVEPVYIAKDGAWYWDDKLADIKLYSSGEIDQLLLKIKPASLEFKQNETYLTKTSSITGRRKSKKIDIAYTALHGTNGEDGSIQGLMNLAGVPLVGCGLEASVISMNKVLSKQLVDKAGVLTPKYISFNSGKFTKNSKGILEEVNKKLKYPLFVKPAHLGSSIGISKVTKKDQLLNAVEVALHHDELCLVEEGVENLVEVTLPIIGTTDEPELASVEQSKLNKEGVFDFETKYIGQGNKNGKGQKSGNKLSIDGYSKIPAEINKSLMRQCQELGIKVWKELGLYGIARIDMLIDSKNNKIYFNEVNPLPGSLYLHNWIMSGKSAIDLNLKLIDLAKQKYKNEQSLSTTFTTSFLKQF